MNSQSAVNNKRRVMVVRSVIMIVSVLLMAGFLIEKKGIGFVTIRFVVDTQSVPAATAVQIRDDVSEGHWESSVSGSVASIDVEAKMVSSERLWVTHRDIDLLTYSLALTNEAGEEVCQTCRISDLVSPSVLHDEEIQQPVKITLKCAR